VTSKFMSNFAMIWWSVCGCGKETPHDVSLAQLNRLLLFILTIVINYLIWCVKLLKLFPLSYYSK
jgi:hypothetical protein